MNSFPSVSFMDKRGRKTTQKMTDIAIVTSSIISEKGIFACKKRLKS